MFPQSDLENDISVLQYNQYEPRSDNRRELVAPTIKSATYGGFKYLPSCTPLLRRNACLERTASSASSASKTAFHQDCLCFRTNILLQRAEPILKSPATG